MTNLCVGCNQIPAIVGQRCHGYVLCSACAKTARLEFRRGIVRYVDADHDVRASRRVELNSMHFGKGKR